MQHPRARSLRVTANPLAGGGAYGLAEPVPWHLWYAPAVDFAILGMVYIHD